LFALAFTAVAILGSGPARAQNVADATLELTFTLTDVTITDTLTANTRSAVFETTTQVGDVIFEDIGPNGSIFSGPAPENSPGSIGSGSASESVLLNGLDPFVDDVDQDSFGIGDSLVSLMNASASAETPGSVFFGQVNSENVLYFSVFGAETDRYTFFFDYTAVLTGSLDSSPLGGLTLGFGDGDEVRGLAETPLAGPPNEFTVQLDYFHLGDANDSSTLMPLDETTSGSFEVAFDPGDDSLSITFLSSLVVNAGVTPVPEPASLSFCVLGALALVASRRRKSVA
jgi:hypothetical protein